MLVHPFIVQLNWPLLVLRSTMSVVSMNFENYSTSLFNLLVPPFFSTSDMMMLKSLARIHWRLLDHVLRSYRSRIIPLLSSDTWGLYTIVDRITSMFLMIYMRIIRVCLVTLTAIRLSTCGFHRVRIPPSIWWPPIATILYLSHCCLLIASILSVVHFVS
jgi:hypothetical protein